MELVPIKEINAVQVFEKGGLQAILDKIKKRAKSFVPDITTAKGRDEIKSIAYQVAKSKTLLDGKGKELVYEIKETTKKIDSERKRARDVLDSLKVEVRLPLTNWENEEKERVKLITDSIAKIQDLSNTTGLASIDIRERIKEVNTLFITNDFAEFENEADIAKDNTVRVLESQLDLVKKQEEDHAELERLRQETAKREQEDREKAAVIETQRAADEKEQFEKERDVREKQEAARLAKEAADKATREAEEKAKAEQERVEHEKREAIEAQEAAERREQEAKVESERLTKKAKEDATRDKELAVLREKERADTERKAEEEKIRKREANKKHRARIKTESMRGIKGIYGIDEKQASAIFDEIAAGSVPHISVNF